MFFHQLVCMQFHIITTRGVGFKPTTYNRPKLQPWDSILMLRYSKNCFRFQWVLLPGSWRPTRITTVQTSASACHSTTRKLAKEFWHLWTYPSQEQTRKNGCKPALFSFWRTNFKREIKSICQRLWHTK